MPKIDPLLLDNQLCFPLYAVSKEIVRSYGPLLKELDLTYTQYIAMMVLWEEQSVTVKHLGERLFLDSGTLTPLIKKLEAKGYVERHRVPQDERTVEVGITKAGSELRERALSVPQGMASCIKLEPEEALALRKLLDKIMDNLQSGDEQDAE